MQYTALGFRWDDETVANRKDEYQKALEDSRAMGIMDKNIDDKVAKSEVRGRMAQMLLANWDKVDANKDGFLVTDEMAPINSIINGRIRGAGPAEHRPVGKSSDCARKQAGHRPACFLLRCMQYQDAQPRRRHNDSAQGHRPRQELWRQARGGWHQLRVRAANSMPCSAPMARARPRRCAWWRACSRRMQAGSACSTSMRARDPLAAKQLIAWLPDEPLLYDKLTAWEYLEFVAGLWGVTPRVRATRGGAAAEAARPVGQPQ